MQQQYWTAVITVGEKTFITDNFVSFSPSEAAKQILESLPAQSRLVALIPGKHAINSVAFSTQTPEENWTRYIDPFENGPANLGVTP